MSSPLYERFHLANHRICVLMENQLKQSEKLNMSSINERIENFKNDISDLRKEVTDIKETLMQQNACILSLLSSQFGTPVPIELEAESDSPDVSDDSTISQLTRPFPLKSFEDLSEFEMEISDNNKTHFVNIIKSLLSPEGIYRKIANVLSYNIIMKSNVNGRHYKTNLLNFPKTMDILFLASRNDGSDSYISFNKFLGELKRSLRLAQNRCHTKNCSIKRKLLRNEQTPEMPYRIVKPSSIVRTQENYFPPYS